MKALYFDNDFKKIALINALTKIYKYAPLLPFSHAQYKEVPEPSLPNERWIKVKNKACGLCGTDIHFIFMEMDPKSFSAATPGINRKFLGHEMVGEVVETGSDAGDITVGDRVCLRIDWPSCYQMEIAPMCSQCSKGNYMLCENLGMKQLPEIDCGGGFSPFMIMHRSQPFKVPQDFSDDQAVLIEPAACAVHGILLKKPAPGDKVLVIGAGTIGLLTAAAAKALQKNADIYLLVRYDFQKEMAMKMGIENIILERSDIYQQLAELTGASYHKGMFNNKILLGGFDIIYDTVGNDSSINNAMRWTKGKGTIVILGINFKPKKIDYSAIWNQEINLTGMNCHATEYTGENSFEIATQFIRSEINTQGMITHRFPMNRYKDAVKTFLSKRKNKAIKIVLEH